MPILVTGGAGFIGSALIREFIADSEVHIINFDKLTYAASPEALAGCEASGRYTFVQADIGDRAALERVFADHRPSGIINLAAESHVDRSIRTPSGFVRTNLVGTSVLLETARSYWNRLPDPARDNFRFLHVSTDEVFGTLGESDPPFTEQSPYAPRSPYAASKAGADHLVRAWAGTYGFPALITHGSNNFGPWQHPEKLIPTTIVSALEGHPIPVYGLGTNVREWIPVADHAQALASVFRRGRVGESYLIGTGTEYRNIDLVRLICRELDAIRPAPDNRSYVEQIAFVADRPGHDFRYALRCDKIRKELDWRPAADFREAIRATIRWYADNEPWWRAKLAEKAGATAPAECDRT